MPRQLIRNMGNSLNNNGTTTITTINTVAAQDSLTAISMCAWINIRGYGEGTAGRIFAKGSGQSPRARISTTSGSSVNAFQFAAQHTVGTSGIWRTPTNSILTGRWYFVCATISDMSDINIDPLLYINAVSQTVTETATPTNSLDADDPTAFIGNSSTSDRTFDGFIHDVQFYNKVLSQAEIDNIYYKGITTSGLVGRWKLDEGSGTTATDSSSSTTNGTIANGSWSTDVAFRPRQLVRDMGTCLSLNGTSSKSISALWSTAKSNISMGAWFRTNNFRQSRQPIITNGSGSGSNGYALLINNASSTDGTVYLLNHGIVFSSLGFKITDSNWHHIMISIDASDNISTYLDGVLKDFRGNASLTTPAVSSGFGSDTNGFFNGSIDDGRFYAATALTGTEIANLYRGVEPSVTPTNWYKFNEGSGTTAIDSGSSAKDGTITSGTYSTDVAFKPRTAVTNRFLVRDMGTCLQFNGSTSYVDTTFSPSFAAADSFSISLWANIPKGATGQQHLVGIDAAAPFSQVSVLYNVGSNTGRPSFFVSDSNGGDNLGVGTGTADLRDNTWHHWCFVKSGTTGTLYIDGVSVASDTGTDLSSTFPARTVYIGAINDGSISDKSVAKIDEVSWIDGALTLAQVNNICFKGKYPSTSKSFYYKFDEGSGTSVTDSSGNNRTGTITGATYSTDVAFKPRTLIT